MAWELAEDVIYPQGKTYKGPAETCAVSFELGPEQLDPVGQRQMVDQMVDSALQSVEEQGATPLRLTVWRDPAPTWTTPYYVVITAHDSPIPLLIWAAIFAVMFLLLAIVIAYTVHEVKGIDWTGGITETAKWIGIGSLGLGGLVLAAALVSRR